MEQSAPAERAPCPVPHAHDQPLPPGHPSVPDAVPSSLQPPPAPQCIFFRQPDDGPTDGADSPAVSQTLGPAQALGDANSVDSDVDVDHLVVLSSRSSALAVCQAEQVHKVLDAHYGKNAPAFMDNVPAHLKTHIAAVRTFLQNVMGVPDEQLRPFVFQARTMATTGDVNLRSPLYVIGGEGCAIWTKELEVVLENHGVDVIIHSLKDVPTTLPKGMELAAILEREDPRDALVVKSSLPYTSLDEMPSGSVIGTSSVRRVALLRRAFPHLLFSDVRGNIYTRLAKLDAPDGPYTALVLAAAGLKRMDLSSRITAYLTAPVMLHAVGQGALGVEVRTPTGTGTRDAHIKALIASVGDWRTTWRCAAERALLHRIEGGCSVPLGVTTTFADHREVEGLCKEPAATSCALPLQDPASAPSAALARCPPETGCELTLRAVIVSLDGKRSCEYVDTKRCHSVHDAEQLGIQVADDLEQRQGARLILDEVEKHRQLAQVADEKRRAADKAARKQACNGAMPPEIDRRFVPRDDGEAKAWEV
ncbi:hydroxymethylbilane synthase [Malassezia vespertilionis]|uniref:hydroxymethylbilane synthase n=1 Tax=Malassezia vespertilionis TaxID=2020962 RepID=A0A2N1J9A6_9BASI|nr:hydroxymethylbilane synthase [Malassezia vespertilionis]PKI83141.1 Hem3p [Malassezia vespertilionis]WFD07690.1 hydroxymethylbilane synthase [Malassezia vespertilionis]